MLFLIGLACILTALFGPDLFVGFCRYMARRSNG